MTNDQIVALLQTRSIGRATVWEILRQYPGDTLKTAVDLADALAQVAKENARIVVPTVDDLRASLDGAQEALEVATRYGVRALSAADSLFPSALKTIPTAPVMLYAKGNLDCLSVSRAVAVIGTRNPTEFGLRSAKRFGEVFANANFTVVSGLAKGCDTGGHRGCLDAKGKTIAVLAHGLDTVFPAENQALADEIVEAGGLLLSEYPIGTRSMPHNFIERDRLQSGLSRGVVVVETGVKGGTMHTVEACRKQGRLLGCFQHPPKHQAPSMAGNRILIEERGAFPIATKNDLDIFIQRLSDGSDSPAPLPPKKPLGQNDPSQLPLFED